jgi:hypothetical protein
MLIVCHATRYTDNDIRKAASFRDAVAADPMSPSETHRYRIAMVALLSLLLAVIVCFSPLGIGS